MTKTDSIEMMKEAALAGEEKQAIGALALDIRGVSSLADGFVFLGGNSFVHVHAIEDAVRKRMKEKGVHLRRTDGQRTDSWRVLDYGDFIVHVMEQVKREFYSLERLWLSAKIIPLKKLPNTSVKPKVKKKPARKTKKAVKKKTAAAPKTAAKKKKKSAKKAIRKKVKKK